MLIMVALMLGLSQPAQGSARPLPELSTFLGEVRKHLRSDRLLLSQYTYSETQTLRFLDKSGNAKKTEVTVSEVYPSLEEKLTYRRVISRNGKPVSAEELAKRDREQDRKLAEYARRLERENAGQRTRRLAKEAEEREREDEAIDEMFRIYDIRIVGRESLNPYSAIRLSFHPVRGCKPRTEGGKVLAKVAGEAWFSEEDHQLMRIEAELIEDFSIGFGILAKLHKGARMVFERARVNDEIWLPAAATFSGAARIMLFKGVRVQTVSEYSNHRKFTVRTSVTYRRDENP